MKGYNMDDGEIELSDHVLLPNPDSSGSLQSSASVDSLLDEFLKNTRTCTHTHTCNPLGPDITHTHTCYHTHTQVITSEEDDDVNNREHSNSKVKRPAGNREAVRKRARDGHGGSPDVICLSSSMTRGKDNICAKMWGKCISYSLVKIMIVHWLKYNYSSMIKFLLVLLLKTSMTQQTWSFDLHTSFIVFTLCESVKMVKMVISSGCAQYNFPLVFLVLLLPFGLFLSKLRKTVQVVNEAGSPRAVMQRLASSA
ncbi:hypothetical protein D5086_000195 [Populus alba]|uniref:Uncharacterized protein n=1 Tax=Populus alba TaxID=43335 RepID=A0ACC4CWA7_POPAL